MRNSAPIAHLIYPYARTAANAIRTKRCSACTAPHLCGHRTKMSLPPKTCRQRTLRQQPRPMALGGRSCLRRKTGAGSLSHIRTWARPAPTARLRSRTERAWCCARLAICRIIVTAGGRTVISARLLGALGVQLAVIAVNKTVLETDSIMKAIKKTGLSE